MMIIFCEVSISGDTISVEVEPFDTVKNVKAKIEDVTGLPVKYQRLIYAGKMLENGPALSDYNIRSEAKIHVNYFVDLYRRSQNRIFVNVKDGLSAPKIITLSVNLDVDTVQDTKTLLKHKERELSSASSTNQLKLILAGKELEDSSLELYSYKVYHHSILTCVLVPVHSTCHGLVLEVKTFNAAEKYVIVQAVKSDTVGDVKKLIQNQKEIPIAQQRLIFDGKELTEDDCTLEKYGINTYSTLHIALQLPFQRTLAHLSRLSLSIFLPTGKVSFPVDVNVGDTAVAVKKAIEVDYGIPVDQQELHVKGHVISDNEPLQESTIISLFMKRDQVISISILLPGKKIIHIDIRPQERVLSLKREIECTEIVDTLILAENQILFYDGNMLLDNHTLSHYFLQQNSTINLIVPVNIDVQLPNEQIVEMKSDSDETFRSLKIRFSQAFGFPIERQRVMYKYIETIDDRCLADYNIFKSCQLSIKLKPALATTSITTVATSVQTHFKDPTAYESFVLKVEEKSFILPSPISGTLYKLQDKAVQFNFLTSFKNNLQAHMISQRLYTVFGRYELFEWEKMGIRIEIPAGAVDHDNGCDIAVIPLLHGDFAFPDGYVPAVSGVYAISTSRELLKPLIIHMQHCVELSEADDFEQLQFFKAEHDGIQPPYEFLPFKAGNFHSEPGYGVLECKSFTLIAIMRNKFRTMMNRRPIKYRAQILYSLERPFWKVIIFVIKSINSIIQGFLQELKAKLPGCQEGGMVEFYFEDDTVEFKTSSTNSQHWNVVPLQEPCKIDKSSVDDYGSSWNALPFLSYHVYPEPGCSANYLYQQVSIKGAEKQDLSLCISLSSLPLVEHPTREVNPPARTQDKIEEVAKHLLLTYQSKIKNAILSAGLFRFVDLCEEKGLISSSKKDTLTSRTTGQTEEERASSLLDTICRSPWVDPCQTMDELLSLIYKNGGRSGQGLAQLIANDFGYPLKSFIEIDVKTKKDQSPPHKGLLQHHEDTDSIDGAVTSTPSVSGGGECTVQKKDDGIDIKKLYPTTEDVL